MEKDYQPRHKRRETPEQIILGATVVAQFVSLFVGVYYYNTWYGVSKVGASAVISSLLCGLSQGLLQLIIYRQFDAASILKFYCWGIINGFWTVS